MADGRTPDPRDRSGAASSGRRHSLANGHRLEALGEAIDRKSGVQHKTSRAVRGRRSNGRRVAISGVVLLGILAGVLGGGYLYAQWRFDKIHKIHVAGEVTAISGQPFNVLELGSDSRAGLTGAAAAMTGAGTAASPGGQRSDVVKIMHIDPAAGTITTLSIPRDTVVTLLANQAKNGDYNRLNVNFGSGPSLVAQTITANLGIPINHTIVVSFAGIINAATAIGGVYLNFPYPALDTNSGLNIKHPGCQLVNRLQALALVRSRHYEWFENGSWDTDVTSDYGRIYRQDQFIKAVINRAKHLYNPLTLNSLLSKLPQGITLDDTFSLNELIGLAVKFHNLNSSSMIYDTLPTVPAHTTALGDILYVDEPTTEKMLTSIFGSQLLRPTNPPPNQTGVAQMPPVIAVAKHTTTTKHTTKHTTKPSVTTTTVAPEGQQFFDPTPCTP